ncbi:MAG: hypothetical protein JSV68_11405 [Anaerolineaceae bacterium]|nr:MAG: hypothetical protein JSV68_11405 [Anaerolineaceae bacterium]
MGEREPPKEKIQNGELFFLWHPGSADTFSGYGLTLQEGSDEVLVGLLMVDRPNPVDPRWLEKVETTFGAYQLTQMTSSGERGILCQMRIDPESRSHLRQPPLENAPAIKEALEPLLEEPPKPVFSMHWDEEARLWRSGFAPIAELPPEICKVFENSGYGCLAAETNIGVVHVCHAPDADIEGFADKPVLSQWQLIEMPTAPLIRLQLTILDRPDDPYRFESFLNVAAEDQAQVLAELANQKELHLAFYGDDLGYRYTKTIPHSEQQWQQLDDLVAMAEACWNQLPTERRDFDQAKADYMRDSE